MLLDEFIPLNDPPLDYAPDSLWFVFQRDKLVVYQDQRGTRVLEEQDIDRFALVPFATHLIGTFRQRLVYTARVPDQAGLPEPLFLLDLRRLAMQGNEFLFTLAGRAHQIQRWDVDHTFCSRCGTATVNHPRDRAKLCPACGYTQYPRISPCIITLISRGSSILLARSPQWPLSLFSTLAGFVEPGETLEQAVCREVFEEVGIQVGNLTYYGSQPWPFPHSLMVGFHGEYLGGDIEVDGVEISEAHWFPIDQLPTIPPPGSISHQLIQDHLARYSRL